MHLNWHTVVQIKHVNKSDIVAQKKIYIVKNYNNGYQLCHGFVGRHVPLSTIMNTFNNINNLIPTKFLRIQQNWHFKFIKKV